MRSKGVVVSCGLIVKLRTLVPHSTCVLTRFRGKPKDNGRSRECRGPRLSDAGLGASVAELVDAGDSHSPGTLQAHPCMLCGFDSRLRHHQSAGARRGRGRPTPSSKRSCGEPCQQSGKGSTRSEQRWLSAISRQSLPRADRLVAGSGKISGRTSPASPEHPGKQAHFKRQRVNVLQQLRHLPTEIGPVPMPHCPCGRPKHNGRSRKCRGPRLDGADPGASVAELVDAGDSHSPGTLQTQLCTPCGFDSRLRHHQTADARRGQGRPTPSSKRSWREPCQLSG